MIQVGEPRPRAYLDLLERGLLAIREQAYAGRVDLCEIEADHIHNVPSLLDESNENRHIFYILKERNLYLERLRALGDPEYLKHRASRCSQPWAVLADIAGVELRD